MAADLFKNKKLLFITHGYYQGGASSSFASTIQRAQDKKIKFKIVLQENKNQKH